jgi:hypothetical protein
LGGVVAVTKLPPQHGKEYRFSIIFVNSKDKDKATKQLKFGFISEQDMNSAYTLIEELSQAAAHVENSLPYTPQINFPEFSGDDICKADWDKLLTHNNGLY